VQVYWRMWNLHRYLGGAVWLLSHLLVAAVTFLLLWLGWIGRSRVVGALCKLADMAGSNPSIPCDALYLQI
jgi:hypothetical protein